MTDSALALLSWFGNHAELIIALCALALSVHQGIISRRHERLAARPFLSIDRRFVLERNKVELVLCNHGPGTAYITGFEIFLDGKRREIGDDVWYSLGNELTLPFSQGGGVAYANGDAVPPHSETTIATYSSQNMQLAGMGKEVMQQFFRVSVRIGYKSTFNEKYELKFPR